MAVEMTGSLEKACANFRAKVIDLGNALLKVFPLDVCVKRLQKRLDKGEGQIMCDYQGKHFGATYEDACCIDGLLWDLDSCEEPGGALSSGGEIPCPQCNETEYRAYCEDYNDGRS